MSGILSKYVNLEVLTDDGRAHELVKSFAALTEEQSAQLYAGDNFVGRAFIKDSPGEEPAILELVVASDGADTMVTLFKPHPLFNSRDSYREGRDELLQCILDLANASVAGVAIMCPLRKRKVHVRDMGIMQMVELLQSAVNVYHGASTASH